MIERKKKVIVSARYDEAKKKAVVDYPEEDALLPEIPEEKDDSEKKQ